MNEIRGILVEFMGNQMWRAWDRDRHQHSMHGSGSLCVYAKTQEEAIRKLGSEMFRSQPGLSCVEGVCPEWKSDIW